MSNQFSYEAEEMHAGAADYETIKALSDELAREGEAWEAMAEMAAEANGNDGVSSLADEWRDEEFI